MENQVSRKASKKVSTLISDLKSGKIVTLPTETVFGYAVSLGSREGILDLMRLKSRGFDSGKVFTLVPPTTSDIAKYVHLSPIAASLIEQYIPGELTLILPKNPNFQHFYYDHFAKIGIRIPNHPIFDEILPKVGPLLLTSANPRGGTPRSDTGHLPSTIVDCSGETPQVIRQGNLIIKI